jgi:hypothetical protein
MSRPSTTTLVSTTRLAAAPDDSAPVPAATVPAVARVPLKAPSASLAALEMRASYEYMAFFMTFVAGSSSLYLLPSGDGHPVMVLPPFIADDSYTAPLRWVLGSRGYSVHGWRLGTNLSRTAKIVNGLPHRLLELHERHGAKVSLVGHSGGGNWARDLAREYPYAVRQVITLGAPFRLRPGDATQADQLAELLLRDQVAQDPAALVDEEDRPPIAVPVTAIYSRTDGVAPWHAGIESAGPLRENIFKWSAATAASPTTPPPSTPSPTASPSPKRDGSPSGHRPTPGDSSPSRSSGSPRPRD